MREPEHVARTTCSYSAALYLPESLFSGGQLALQREAPGADHLSTKLVRRWYSSGSSVTISTNPGADSVAGAAYTQQLSVGLSVLLMVSAIFAITLYLLPPRVA
jgi:hypothetical protein